MSILKSVKALAMVKLTAARKERAIHNAMLRDQRNDECRNMSPYDSSITYHFTYIDDVKIEIRKRPLGFCEVIASHQNGIQLECMIEIPKGYTNVRAAYDNGVLSLDIQKLCIKVNKLIQKQICV